MNALKSILALFALALLPCVCLSQEQPLVEKPRIAILQLKNENASDLEVSVLTHLIENYFVNTNRYTVLERQDIDKVRRERAATDVVVTTDTEAARLGKLLNVQDIVIGTLMFFQGRYFCEIRMIDVRTSSIEKSCTETCESNDEFAFAAKRVVEKISGVSVGYQCAIAAPGRPDSQAPPPQVAEPPQLAQFHSAGLSSDDCDRYLKSGAHLDIWTRQSRVSPVLCGCLGVLPVASGHYLMHNYGLGVFFSMVKTISVLGITQTLDKGGDQRQWTAAYCVTLSAATIADIITSANSAAAYDRGLDILSHGAAVAISDGPHGPGLNLAFTF
jgi:hypothetical protein